MRTEGRIQIGTWVLKRSGPGWVWGRARARVIGGKVTEEMVNPHHSVRDEPQPIIIVGAWVRERRSELRLTQRQLCEVSGVSERALREIEAGRSDPQLSTVTSLFQELTR